MNILFSLAIVVLLATQPHIAVQEPTSQEADAYTIERIMTTDDCTIAFVSNVITGQQYVVKQIKNPLPDEQFLLVIDATACHLAQELHIPINCVEIHPPHSPVTSIINEDWPATLHTRIPGHALEDLPDHEIDIHQRKTRPKGLQNRALCGLTHTVIKSMAMHPELPLIVAFDTFVGNADRSLPNLFYDAATDSFYGIDLSASWCTPLGEYALERLRELYNSGHTFNAAEQQALRIYTATLERLLKAFSPDYISTLLQKCAEKAGFSAESPLYDQDVQERICFHNAMIKRNHQSCTELVQFLHSQGF